MLEGKDKDQWIENVLQSVHSLEDAVPSPFLYSKIINRISHQSEPAARPFLITAAAGLCFFCLINVFSIQFFLSESTDNVSATDDLATEYYATETITELYY
ncbi:MAG: hypothetical protein H7259_04400 [Cytophagales bacterium]|nr:hypothetical protein [Cytophaga sp.]